MHICMGENRRVKSGAQSPSCITYRRGACHPDIFTRPKWWHELNSKTIQNFPHSFSLKIENH